MLTARVPISRGSMSKRHINEKFPYHVLDLSKVNDEEEMDEKVSMTEEANSRVATTQEGVGRKRVNAREV